MKKHMLKSLFAASAIALAGIGAANAQSIMLSEADVQLQETVKAALYADKRLNNAIFNVAALNGRVSVTGTLASDAQAGPAFQVARLAAAGAPVTTFLEAPVG